MDLIFSFYLLVVGLTVATTLYLAQFAWSRRQTRGAVAFALAMLAIAEAAVMYILVNLTPDPTLAFVWERLRFVGLAATPVLILTFVFGYTNRTPWRSRKLFWALWIVPIITQLVLWLAPNTLFFRQWELVQIGAAILENPQFTGWFWIHLLYSALILIIAVLWLSYYSLRVDKSLWPGARWMIAGTIAGLVGSLPGFTIGPAPGFRFTPIGLGITGFSLAVALIRYRLLDRRPIAYDAIFQGMRDAVIIVDERNAVVQVNPVAECLLNQNQAHLVGKDVRTLFSANRELVEQYIDVREAQFSLSIITDNAQRYLDVHISPLYQQDRFVGRIIVLYDITEREQADQVLDETMSALTYMNEELRNEITKREHAETRFQNLLEIAPDGIMITDTNGAITLVNAQVEKLFGWSRQELIGQPIEVLVIDSLRDIHVHHRSDYYLDPRMRLMAAGKALVARRKDGKTFPCEISLSPLQTAEGTFVMSIVRDITGRQEAAAALNERNRTLQALHETASDIGAELNTNILLHHVVERAMRLLDADRGGSVYLYEGEHNHLRLAAGAGVNQNRVGMTVKPYKGVAGQVFRTAQPMIVNDYTQFEDDATIHVLVPPNAVLGVPLIVKMKAVGVLVLIANSQFKKFQQRDIELAQMFASYASVAFENARLYDQAQKEIKERIQAEQEREQLIAELNAFTHTVAHDLKAPIALIHGYYGLLDETLEGHPDAMTHDMLGAIGNSTRKMTKIIDELLIFASVRHLDEIKTGPLPMEKIVYEAVSRLKFMVEERQANIMMGDMTAWPIASGYAPWIEEVWTNYLSNALKYGGNPPSIELGASLEPGSRVRYWVRDNGQGLSPEQQAQLFQKYMRLDTMRFDGHGLGLSIVKQIINKLGGEVAVESTLGAGSTFSFTLPQTEATDGPTVNSN